MTRLQDAQKQLSEALVVMESAVNQMSASASLSQTYNQTNVGSDLSALAYEVSIIEIKLSEAIAMIVEIDSSEAINGDAE